MENEDNLRQDAALLPIQVKTIQVIDNTTLGRANEALLVVNNMMKRVSAYFDPLIDKAKGTYKEAVDLKKEVYEPLKELKKYLNKEIANYLDEQEKKRLQAELAERKRQESLRKVEEGNTDELFDEELPSKEVIIPEAKPETKGIHTREIWKWRIKDPTKVPREFLMIDQVAVNNEVRKRKADTNIPGIEVYKDTIVATR